MKAARDGDMQSVKAELGASGNIDQKSFSGNTSLMYAAQRGHAEIVNFLLANDASVTVFGPVSTPLEVASRGGSAQITQMLLQAGANTNDKNCYGETALMWAAARGATDIVELLLKNGADVSIRDDEGKTALAWAMKLVNTVNEDRYETVSSLLSATE